MTGVQWKQTTVLRASSTYLVDVNNITGRPRQECECERQHTCCFVLTPAQGFPGTWENHAAEASGPGFQLLTQGSHLFKRNAPQHQCLIPGNGDIDMTCQASCPVTQAASRGPYLGISTSSHLRFLALPGLPGGSPVSPGLLGEVPSLPRPSWGSPQPRQAFLEGLPNFPGSFLRAQGYGGHRQSDPWVTYSVLQTHSLQLCVCWNPRAWAL